MSPVCEESKWKATWFTDCSSEFGTSSSVQHCWTFAQTFYLPCRVQRPQQTHTYTLGKQVRDASKRLTEPHTQRFSQFFVVYTRLHLPWRHWEDTNHKKSLIVRLQRRAAAKKYVSWKGPAVSLHVWWRQGSKCRWSNEPLKRQLLFNRWESTQSGAIRTLQRRRNTSRPHHSLTFWSCWWANWWVINLPIRASLSSSLVYRQQDP